MDYYLPASYILPTGEIMAQQDEYHITDHSGKFGKSN